MNRILKSIILISILISCQQTEEIEDIIVIGGGLMGSLTAWELSKNGENVLVIEQQDSIYSYGSSLGEARISRSLGPKNDIFSYLQQTSVSETQQLIHFLNEGKKGNIHEMEDIYTTSPVTYIYYQSQINEVTQLLDDQTDTYEFAPNSEKALAMFGMTIPDSAMVIREFKKYSGTLNPKVLISKLHEGIKISGNKILHNEKVTNLRRRNELYEIEITNTKTGQIKTLLSKKVVSAAGPYTGILLKNIAPYFDKLIQPKRLFLAFLKMDNKTYESYSAEQKKRLINYYPVADLNPTIYYSMIEKYDEEGIPIIKVGGHFLRTDIEDLDSVWQKELTAQEIEWSRENTFNYLSKLNLPVQISDLHFLKGYSCVYSLTESEIPYVTNVFRNNHELDPNFVVVGGMSGIGAKGSLTYGLMASNLLMNKEDTSAIYQKTKNALGSDRLLENMSRMSE